mgnify:CR=1 FL=1
MSNIESNEQWLLDGDCSKCRRVKYCKKPCTKVKRIAQYEMRSMIRSAINKVTGGAYEHIMDESSNTVI